VTLMAHFFPFPLIHDTSMLEVDHPDHSSTAPATLKSQDVVSLVSSVSSVMMSDSSMLIFLLSLSFLLGVWVRENTAKTVPVKPAVCRNCHKAQLTRGGSETVGRQPPTSQLQHRKQIKRKLYVHPSVDSEYHSQTTTTTTTQPTVDDKLLVTRPRQIYKVQDLVPPSFFVPQNSLDYFQDPRPATYQSFLVRKFNLKPVQEIMQSEPPVIIMEQQEQEQEQEEEQEQEDWLRGSNLEENQAGGTWTGSTDWLQHWIE